MSLFEISYKKNVLLFHHILFIFLDVPVHLLRVSTFSAYFHFWENYSFKQCVSVCARLHENHRERICCYTVSHEPLALLSSGQRQCRHIAVKSIPHAVSNETHRENPMAGTRHIYYMNIYPDKGSLKQNMKLKVHWNKIFCFICFNDYINAVLWNHMSLNIRSKAFRFYIQTGNTYTDILCLGQQGFT